MRVEREESKKEGATERWRVEKKSGRVREKEREWES